jgi:hypothetical protein
VECDARQQVAAVAESVSAVALLRFRRDIVADFLFIQFDLVGT